MGPHGPEEESRRDQPQGDQHHEVEPIGDEAELAGEFPAPLM